MHRAPRAGPLAANRANYHHPTRRKDYAPTPEKLQAISQNYVGSLSASDEIFNRGIEPRTRAPVDSDLVIYVAGITKRYVICRFARLFPVS
jgi:hypothetical protein